MGTTYERDGETVTTQLLADNYRIGLIGEPGVALTVCVTLPTTLGADSCEFAAGDALDAGQLSSLSAIMAALRTHATEEKGYAEKT